MKSKLTDEFYRFSDEKEVGKVIDETRSGLREGNTLIPLLSERHVVYDERGTSKSVRIKGYALASFEKLGLPMHGVTYVLEELESGRDAYLVGAAARALRGFKKPGPQFVPYLFMALNNIRLHDDSMSFDEFRPSWPLSNPTSAQKEIFKTFGWLRGYAKAAIPELEVYKDNGVDFDPETRREIDIAIRSIESDKRDLDLSCCEDILNNTNTVNKRKIIYRKRKSIKKLIVENQFGEQQELEHYLGRTPTVVAFFYTRCMNPKKCTLTINKLSHLHLRLKEQNIIDSANIIAFTYDPSYDSAERMLIFGKNRGLEFDDNVQMLRTTNHEDFEQISDHFQLGVNYSGNTVSFHRIELFLLDDNGVVSRSYTRHQWKLDQIVENVQEMTKRTLKKRLWSPVSAVVKNFVIPILIIFFPKCPVCWAAYLSVFGISGLEVIPYSPWLLPILCIAVGINLFTLWKNASVRNGMVPFFISLFGALIVVSFGYISMDKTIAFWGVMLMIIGALLNSLPFESYARLINFLEMIYRNLKMNVVRR